MYRGCNSTITNTLCRHGRLRTILHAKVCEMGDIVQRNFLEILAGYSDEQDDRTSDEQSNSDNVYTAMGSWNWDLTTGCLTIKVPERELQIPVGQEKFSGIEPWSRVIHPEDIPLLGKTLADLVSGRIPGFGIRIRMQCMSPPWQWMFVTGSTGSVDGSGLPARLEGVLFDVPRRDEAEQHDPLPLLIGILQHDLLNRLSMIVGYWEILQERIPEDSSMQGHAVGIGRGIDSLVNKITHIDDALNVRNRTPGWQHLAEAFKAASVGILPEIVCLQLSDDLPEIFADPLLASACTNLLDNATRHGGGITTISISAEPEGDAIAIFVEDDGVGIPPALKSRIFDPGYGKHLGYGLSFTRTILERTGLSIEECGEGGCGAKFKIRLPPGSFRPVQSESRGDRVE